MLHLLGDTRSATWSSLRAPVELLGDQLLVPAQERIGSHEGRHFLQARAPERVGERREAAAFGIGEAELAATELGFEDAVFLLKIGNDVLLVTLDPAGDQGDEDIQDHRVPWVESCDVMVRSSILPTWCIVMLKLSDKVCAVSRVHHLS
jgi:hypothetical protein